MHTSQHSATNLLDVSHQLAEVNLKNTNIVAIIKPWTNLYGCHFSSWLKPVVVSVAYLRGGRCFSKALKQLRRWQPKQQKLAATERFTKFVELVWWGFSGSGVDVWCDPNVNCYFLIHMYIYIYKYVVSIFICIFMCSHEYGRKYRETFICTYHIYNII